MLNSPTVRLAAIIFVLAAFGTLFLMPALEYIGLVERPQIESGMKVSLPPNV